MRKYLITSLFIVIITFILSSCTVENGANNDGSFPDVSITPSVTPAASEKSSAETSEPGSPSEKPKNTPTVEPVMSSESPSPSPTESPEPDYEKIAQEALDNEHDHTWVLSHYEERHPHEAVYKCDCGATKHTGETDPKMEMKKIGISKEHPHYILEECSICSKQIPNPDLPTPLTWLHGGYSKGHPHYLINKCSQCEYTWINEEVNAIEDGSFSLIVARLENAHPHYAVIECNFEGCDHTYIEKNAPKEWELETDGDDYETAHPHFIHAHCNHEGCSYTEKTNMIADWEWKDGVCSICGQAKDVLYKNMHTHVEITGAKEEVHVGPLVIPREIESVDVREIGQNAFADQAGITEISIPDTIDLISHEAFADCTNTIFNPSGECPVCMTQHGMPHDEDCELAILNELPSELQLPVSFYSKKLCYMGVGAFRNCLTLESFIFGEYIRNIEDSVFEGCHNLRQIIILRMQAPDIQPEAFKGTHPELLILVPEGASGYDTPEWEQYNINYIPIH